MEGFIIRCSNGEYVKKTSNGFWVTTGKKPKVWTSENLVEKNLRLCETFAEKNSVIERYGKLIYKIEKLWKN